MDQLRVGLHLCEDPSQRGEQIIHATEVAVMGPILARVLPQPFRGIELRRVGRQLMHFQPVTVGLEPCPYIAVFMVRGVVLNQDRSLAAVSPGQLFEESEVGRGVEDGVPAIVEAGAPEFDGTENLYTFALSTDGNFRRMADTAPGRMQRRVLPKAGLVGKDQRPIPGLGFFFKAG